MIQNDQILIQRIESFIINELISAGHIFISEYYGPYEMNDSFKKKLINDYHFTKYLDDHMTNFLFKAMLELLPKNSSYEKIVKDTLENFKYDPFWINKVLEKMK